MIAFSILLFTLIVISICHVGSPLVIPRILIIFPIRLRISFVALQIPLEISILPGPNRKCLFSVFLLFIHATPPSDLSSSGFLLFDYFPILRSLTSVNVVHLLATGCPGILHSVFDHISHCRYPLICFNQVFPVYSPTQRQSQKKKTARQLESPADHQNPA
jgi:hypothetical protein